MKYLKLFEVIGLTLLLLIISWITFSNSTPITKARSILPAANSAFAPVLSVVDTAASNSVANAFINAIPSSDGTEIVVFARGINATGNPVYLNVDPGTGGGSSKGAHAMTLSGTTHIATAIGFAPGQDVGNLGDATMSISTTVSSQVQSTGDINFQRAFLVTASNTETINVDGGMFEVTIPNTNTFPTDIYAVVMSTNALPGALPIGYSQAGSAYNVSPSGALTQSEKLMVLNLGFKEPLPGNSDPHTLAIVHWDRSSDNRKILEGNLFDDTNQLNLATQTFGIFGLTTTPNWRDSFKEFSLTGVSALSNTQWGPGDTIILGAGVTSGTVTSIPITPTGSIASWGTLHFSATAMVNTGLTVEVLDANNTVVLANVADGADLSDLSPATYPSLKLRAALTSTTAGQTPQLREWSLSWIPLENKIYLPMVIKNEA